MPNGWTSKDLILFMLAATVSLCLLAIVACVTYGVLTGILDPKNLGYVRFPGICLGLLGVMYILCRVIIKIFKILHSGGE